MAKKLEVVSTKVPPSLFAKIEQKVDGSNYMSISDFTRQAIREKINENGGQK